MKKYSFKKPVILSSLVIFVVVSISVSTNNMSYAFLVLDYGDTNSSSSADTSVDRSITSSQSSYQSSYCYAPANASIINSCNSGDLSTSENTGLNIYK